MWQAGFAVYGSLDFFFLVSEAQQSIFGYHVMLFIIHQGRHNDLSFLEDFCRITINFSFRVS